jgi:hypothetical protein
MDVVRQSTMTEEKNAICKTFRANQEIIAARLHAQSRSLSSSLGLGTVLHGKTEHGTKRSKADGGGLRTIFDMKV